MVKFEKLVLFSSSSNEVIVMTTHTNDPNFLEIQAGLLKKHLKVPYKFVVGIDLASRSSSANIYGSKIEDFKKVADALGITLIMIPKKIHIFRYRVFPSTRQTTSLSDPALKCSNAVQFMLNNVSWDNFRALLFLDADMFPITDIKDIPVNKTTPLVAVKQSRNDSVREVEYAWNGLFWLNGMDKNVSSINFDLLWEKNFVTDVGGHTIKLISRLKEEGMKMYWIHHFSSQNWSLESIKAELKLSPKILEWLIQDYRNGESGSFYAELYGGCFLHYRGGGNWNKMNKYKERENRAKLYNAIFG